VGKGGEFCKITKLRLSKSLFWIQSIICHLLLSHLNADNYRRQTQSEERAFSRWNSDTR
jgi:hypothetical protein